ncbi:MAG: hypothetical protein QM780_01540 [Hyphomicrobium sp.]|uniref:hypothetical protein n=1 Tax=Hyphomicrobium sp. TaxID=82 RepID=UPI0039E2E118
MRVSVQTGNPARTGRRSKSRRRGLVWRPLLDAAIAGIVFTLVSSTLICNHAKAGIIPAAFSGVVAATPQPSFTAAVAEPGPLPIVQIATAASPADAVFRRTSVTAAWSLLGVAFSLLAALNLAMVRHLKRAYATPPRRFPPEK